MRHVPVALCALAVFSASSLTAQPATLIQGIPDSATLSELRPRSIGPAVMSGRVADIAVQKPTRPGERWG